ncbi:MAG: alpha/beta hydrolase [Acidobacteria bacterium]|jgi:pimeloyl-ACP methyl ester carboxylesterase|nr:alpha/beta hydrolase [Acidobacteriota bacterium]
MKLAFKEYGSGKPIILLHAFPLYQKMWQPQVDEIVAAGFRLILPDLRGFGESHNFSDINSMEDMAKDVAELLDALEIERAVIGGLSMGGYVSFNLYQLFPEKFAALVLFDTNYAADTEEKRESRFNLIEKIEKSGAQALIDNLLPTLICVNTKINNPNLVGEIEKMFAEVNPKAAIAALRGMAERKDHAPILEEINIPTLLIFGEEDKITSFKTAEKMNKMILTSMLVKIENAGHYSSLEQPAQFNSALIDFLSTVEF